MAYRFVELITGNEWQCVSSSMRFWGVKRKTNSHSEVTSKISLVIPKSVVRMLVGLNDCDSLLSQVSCTDETDADHQSLKLALCIKQHMGTQV